MRETNRISCRCPVIKNWFIGIVNDETRILIEKFDLSWIFLWQLLLILIPLFYIGVCGPRHAEHADKIDAYDIANDPKYEKEEFENLLNKVKN